MWTSLLVLPGGRVSVQLIVTAGVPVALEAGWQAPATGLAPPDTFHWIVKGVEANASAVSVIVLPGL